MNKYYICVLCDKKKIASECIDKFTISDKFSICCRCVSHLPYTHGDNVFQGTKYLSYVISSFYYRGYIKNALKNYKFSQQTIFAEIMSRFVTDTLSKHCYIKDFDIIIPIPLSKQRFFQRGYNQSALIAEKVAGHLNISYSENILVRTRNTRRQSSLHGSERISNVLDSFASKSDLSGLRLLLFDDIFTTGNTLNEAAKALRNAGAADVIGITCAIVK